MYMMVTGAVLFALLGAIVASIVACFRDGQYYNSNPKPQAQNSNP